MPIDTSKRIVINYRGAPVWNTALNFGFWILFSVTGFIALYLFLAFILDTTIKRDNIANPGVRQGNPNNYGNIVEINIKAIPIIGRILYP